MPKTLDASLVQDLKSGKVDRASLVFLEPHPTLPRQWLVSSFDPQFGARLGKIVSGLQTVSAVGKNWDDFQAVTAEHGYSIVFMPTAQPEQVSEWVKSLMAPPEVKINSDRPGTIEGFLPFQLQGYNWFKNESFGWLEWDTGTGKTVGGSSLTQYHVDHKIDLSIWAVKAQNKTNTVRELRDKVGIEAILVAGTPAKRDKLYRQIARQMAAGESPVIVVGYENFRTDEKYFTALVTGKRIMAMLDEAPTKIRNRQTKVWKAMCRIFYVEKPGAKYHYPDSRRLRPAKLHAYVASATPVENKLEDVYNVVRLFAPEAVGSVEQFERNHVIRRPMQIVARGGRIITKNEVVGYRNTEEFAISIAHLFHQVDKKDPDIAAQFPAKVKDTIWIDLSDHQQKLYNLLVRRYRDVIEKFKHLQRGHHLTDEDKRELQKLRAVYSVLQMIVDDPALVLESALEWERSGGQDGSEVASEFRKQVGDDSQFEDNGEETRVAKLEALRELVENNTAKMIAFSTNGAPFLTRASAWLTKWGIDHVIYHGSMSANQKQAAEDRFKTDPGCKLFLSSDAGSDSLNFPMANEAIHLNLPWKPSTYKQRQERVDRITSTFEHVRFITMMTETLPELHKEKILEEKRGITASAFEGEIANISRYLRMED